MPLAEQFARASLLLQTLVGVAVASRPPVADDVLVGIAVALRPPTSDNTAGIAAATGPPVAGGVLVTVGKHDLALPSELCSESLAPELSLESWSANSFSLNTSSA